MSISLLQCDQTRRRGFENQNTFENWY